MVRKLFQHVVPAVLKPLRIIWNQIIGFIFLSFAAVGLMRAYPDFRAFDGDAESVGKVVLPSIWVGVMGFFAALSFLKARKISRS